MGRDLTETGAPGSSPLMTFRSGSAAARALRPRRGSRGMSPPQPTSRPWAGWGGAGGAEPAAAPQSRTAGSTALPPRRRVACLTESARPPG